MIETYIQEEGSAYRFQKGIIRNGDDYFLSRLDLTGNSPSIVPFADEETYQAPEGRSAGSDFCSSNRIADRGRSVVGPN
jgi:hypothetical protein